MDKKAWSGDTSKDKFQLGTYSSMSPVHSTLLLIKLKDGISTDETLSLTISTTTSYSDSLVGKDSNNRPTKEIKKSSNPLSSILSFSYFEYDSKPGFDYTDTTFSWKSFYSLPSTGYVTESHYGTDISFGELNSTTRYIAIIMEYYDAGIQYIYSMNLGNSVLEDENDITYTVDWSIRL